MKTVLRNLPFIACIMMLSAATTASADSVLYEFDGIFSADSVAPSGAVPWVDADFQDVSGGVLLTISNADLTGGEFLSSMYLNLNTNLNPTSLLFTPQNSLTTGTFSSPTINPFPQGTRDSANKADGDGYYDILINFSVSGSDSQRFIGGDSVSYLITGITNLMATDFAYLSDPGNGAGSPGPFYVATQIQGIAGGAYSAWAYPRNGPIISVPEPAPIALLTLSIGFWGVLRFRTRKM